MFGHVNNMINKARDSLGAMAAATSNKLIRISAQPLEYDGRLSCITWWRMAAQGAEEAHEDQRSIPDAG